MLIDQIRTMLQEATKGGDSVAVSTYRMLMSALNYKKIQRLSEFNEEDELAVVRLEAKKRAEAIEIYTKAGALDRAKSEGEELAILEKFLPVQVSEDEIRKVVEELKDKAPSKGQLIGMVIGKIGKDRVNGQMVAKVVGEMSV